MTPEKQEASETKMVLTVGLVWGGREKKELKRALTRENNGREKKTSSQALGICKFHLSYL